MITKTVVTIAAETGIPLGYHLDNDQFVEL